MCVCVYLYMQCIFQSELLGARPNSPRSATARIRCSCVHVCMYVPTYVCLHIYLYVCMYAWFHPSWYHTRAAWRRFIHGAGVYRFACMYVCTQVCLGLTRSIYICNAYFNPSETAHTRVARRQESMGFTRHAHTHTRTHTHTHT